MSKITQSYFDFEDRQYTREDHSYLCAKALRDDLAFPTLPSFDVIPPFPLKDIFSKVLGRTEGMFPFLLRVSSDEAVAALRTYFKSQGYCLKQNTAFTVLKSQQVERSTFQVLSPGLQRKRAKVSVYVTKLVEGGNRVIVEFRRSERNPVTVPTEFLAIRELNIGRNAYDIEAMIPDGMLLGAGSTTAVASLADDSWHEESAKTLMDWFLDPNTSFGTITMGSSKSMCRAAAVVETMLTQLQTIRHEDAGLLSSRKRVKIAAPYGNENAEGGIERSSLANMQFQMQGVESGYVAPVDNATALWWNVAAPAPSPTRSSFDDMVDFVLRHCQIKPKSETLQDRIGAFCSALQLREGPRISLLILEGADALWEDLTIIGRWLAVQCCLSSLNSSCKAILLSTKQLGENHLSFMCPHNVLNIKVSGDSECAAHVPPSIAQVIARSQPRHSAHALAIAPAPARATQQLPSSAHINTNNVARPVFPAQQMAFVPKLPLSMLNQSNEHSFSSAASETDNYAVSSPHSDSNSEEFSAPGLEMHGSMDSTMEFHPRPEWDWSTPNMAPPAPMLFPLPAPPAHPALYNVYDTFYTTNTFPTFDLFPRNQPMFFTGHVVN